MKRLTTAEAKSLRRITTAEQLPENAIYYASTTTEWGRYGIVYYRLLDIDFNEVECVRIAYTDLLKNMTHVSDESDNFDHHPARMVYKLTDRNNLGFWKCNKIN